MIGAYGSVQQAPALQPHAPMPDHPSISLIINTCAGSARGTLGSAGIAHSERASTLREVILPRATSDPLIHEVIVVGEWEEAQDGSYRYVECASKRFNCEDALEQRQRGYEAAEGDLMIFMHDDHMLPEDFIARLLGIAGSWDVLVPLRLALIEGAARFLNNGSDESYVMGHAAVYTRRILERAPWSAVPKQFTWDVAHTAQLREAGAQIMFSYALAVWDVEEGEVI